MESHLSRRGFEKKKNRGHQNGEVEESAKEVDKRCLMVAMYFEIELESKRKGGKFEEGVLMAKVICCEYMFIGK